MAVKIDVDQITESRKSISFSEPVEGLGLMYGGAEAMDFHFPPSLEVSLVYYRSGQELFFEGFLSGTVEGVCSRCLKTLSFSIEKPFSFVLTPEPFPSKSRELNRDEMGLSFYSSLEIDLSPFVREQLLLALPMRPLCDDNCRGLCGGCGADLNEGPCLCPAPQGDPRMGTFRSLKSS